MDMRSTQVPRRDELDPRYDALAHFKDWSNYLLVATVAAAGWVGADKVAFAEVWLERATLWCLGLSIVFGIFTLAFVPLLAEQLPRSQEPSIYMVDISFSLFGKKWQMYLTQACRPQHITFIAGVLLFCAGTAGKVGGGDRNAGLIGAAIAIGLAVAVFLFLSVPTGHAMKIGELNVIGHETVGRSADGEPPAPPDEALDSRHDGAGEASTN